MLHSVPIALAAASLFGAAPLPADALGPPADVLGSRQARLAKPLKRTAGPLPRLAASSLDFVLRLYLYLGLICVVLKMRAQDRIEGRKP